MSEDVGVEVYLISGRGPAKINQVHAQEQHDWCSECGELFRPHRELSGHELYYIYNSEEHPIRLCLSCYCTRKDSIYRYCPQCSLPTIRPANQADVNDDDIRRNREYCARRGAELRIVRACRERIEQGATEADIVAYLKDVLSNKIGRVKILREIYGISLREAVWMRDSLEQPAP